MLILALIIFIVFFVFAVGPAWTFYFLIISVITMFLASLYESQKYEKYTMQQVADELNGWFRKSKRMRDHILDLKLQILKQKKWDFCPVSSDTNCDSVFVHAEGKVILFDSKLDKYIVVDDHDPRCRDIRKFDPKNTIEWIEAHKNLRGGAAHE